MNVAREYGKVLEQAATDRSGGTDSNVDRLLRMCRRLRLLAAEAMSIGYSLEEVILMDMERMKK